MSRETLNRTIRNMPWRGGLMTAGHRAIVPETAIWKAVNYTFDLDGTIQKRPGIAVWNSFAIKRITPLESTQALSFHEVFDDLLSWDVTGTDYLKTASNNSLQFSVTTFATTHLEFVSWNTPPSTPQTDDESSIRFMYQIRNLDVVDAGGALTTFIFLVSGGTNSSTVILGIFSGGLYYWDTGQNWVFVAGSASMGTDVVHELEVNSTGVGGSATIIGDGVVLETISLSLIFDLTAKGNFVELIFGQGVSRTAYSGRIWDVMYKNDATAPFTTVPIKAVTDFSIVSDTGESRKFVVVAAETAIYTDTNFKQTFSPLIALEHKETFFTRFRDRLIAINHDNGSNSRLYSWDGKGAAEPQADAPKVRFAVEHKTRLWAAGNVKHPLRVYFSASRQENVWFDPDVDGDETVDEILNAGYLEIPPYGGSEITALFGDFYGSLIVFTDRGIWRIQGSDQSTFQVDSSLSRSEGAVGPLALTPVGNDLWFIGSSGVFSLASTEKFGDIITQTISASILNLWSVTRTSQASVNTNALSNSVLTYLDRTGQVLMALPSSSATELDTIYVYSLSTNEWIGPWEVGATGLSTIELGFPLRNNTVTCLTTGQLAYVDPMRHQDHDGDYSTELQTAMLNGRSLADPSLTGVSRRMRRLRLYFQARGNWDFTIKLYRDGRLYRTEERKQGQAVKIPFVDGTLQADSPSMGLIIDEETIIPVEFNLDFPANNFSFTIETPAEEQHIVLQGYEVDLIPAGTVQGVY